MLKNTANKFRSNLTSLRADERGAESTEVIVVLVVLVIGLLVAFAFLRDKIKAQLTKTGNCIETANTRTSC